MLDVGICDNDSDRSSMLYCMLKRKKFIKVIRVFKNAGSLIEYIKCEPVDVLFMARELSETNIEHVCESVLKIDPEIKVVVYSNDGNFAVKAFEAKVFDYILNPISEERVDKTLEKVFYRKRG